MKRIIGRQEIAKVLNFGKYNVVELDLKNRIELCGKYVGFSGDIVRIDNGYFRSGERFLQKGTIEFFNDEKKLFISGGATCISKNIYYEDYVNMINCSKAPILKGGEEVVLVVKDSEKKIIYGVYTIKLKDSINVHCSTIATFEELDQELMKLLLIDLEKNSLELL